MKVTGIIGFILLLLADLVFAGLTLSLPAGAKTGNIFLIVALIILIVSILYFVSSLKKNVVLFRVSSIALIILPIIFFFTSGVSYSSDVAEYGKYMNMDNAFIAFVILLVLQFIFGIIGLILSFTTKKEDSKTQQAFKGLFFYYI